MRRFSLADPDLDREGDSPASQKPGSATAPPSLLQRRPVRRRRRHQVLPQQPPAWRRIFRNRSASSPCPVHRPARSTSWVSAARRIYIDGRLVGASCRRRSSCRRASTGLVRARPEAHRRSGADRGWPPGRNCCSDVSSRALLLSILPGYAVRLRLSPTSLPSCAAACSSRLSAPC